MNIDAASTALLVVDILVTDASDSLYNPDPQEEALVSKAVQVTRAARSAGLPVLFLCDQHIPGVDRELELWGEHGVKGKAHPHPALEPGSGTRDFVIPKRRYSGFFQTDLDLTCASLASRLSSQWGGHQHLRPAYPRRRLEPGLRLRRGVRRYAHLPRGHPRWRARAHAALLWHEGCHH